ncbi:uncharacterized protein [Linepithema humile]|uniref:uncharacterized protein isoform X2 n=1 Tax=Linepithema humile TaxID=83485 RepID=UPI00351E1B73
MNYNQEVMETLGQIKPVADKIRTSPRLAIYALYRLVFEKDGDRTSRKQLRSFRGFDFDDASDRFRTKLEYSAAFSIGDLTSMCNILGLDYAGTKEELRQKIIRALMDIQSLTLQEDDDDAEAEDEFDEPEALEEPQQRQQVRVERIGNVGSRRTNDDLSSLSGNDSEGSDQNIPRHRGQNSSRITFNFKDVKDTIRAFDGSDHYPIEKWILDFEELAALFEWNNIQKLVFARKSLKGVAKVFVRGLSITQSWEKLKAALKEEFSRKVSSADIHRKLAKRKLKKDENLQEYYLAMRELASQGNIDVESVIQYIVDGIPENSSKVVLYGARDYNEFRARLRTYERIQERGAISSRSNQKKELAAIMDTKRSEIQSYYRDKTIFVTGASGFMGKVLLEKLLYCCSEIDKIYILIRSKKGHNIDIRLSNIFDLPLFQRIKMEKPNVLQKVIPLNGDITSDNLGLTEEQRERLINEVHVVFHCAASTRFDLKLKDAIEMNTISTKRVLDLAKQMKQLECFLHVSTTFSHVEQEELAERIYDSPHNPHDVMKIVQWLDEEAIDLLTPKLMHPHPNSYTYSKCLAETLVVNEYPNLPCCIVRPSLVAVTCRTSA